MAALAAAGRAVPAIAADDTAYAVAQAPPYVYIGCYTPAGRGISIYSVNAQTNVMTLSNIIAPVSNPSWLAMDPTQKYLYAVNEVNAGLVMAFSINAATGELTFLNQQTSGGANPAHMAVHPSGKFVIVANYSGSTVEVIPTLPDGSLAAPTQLVRHIGDLGPNTGRQEAPHPHMVLCDPAGKYVLVNDLGMDATLVYSLDQS
ncbi:MAG: beta-propeller fold lactonase family protein, partial [Bryobacteraceae bacterium]